MHRRTFLQKSLAGAGVVAGMSKLDLAAFAALKTPGKPAVLNLCSQEWLVPGGSVKEKAEKILKWGGCGLEFHGIDVRQAEQIKKELEGTGVRPAALCYGSHKGGYVSLDPATRKKARADFKTEYRGRRDAQRGGNNEAASQTRHDSHGSILPLERSEEMSVAWLGHRGGGWRHSVAAPAPPLCPSHPTAQLSFLPNALSHQTLPTPASRPACNQYTACSPRCHGPRR